MAGSDAAGGDAFDEGRVRELGDRFGAQCVAKLDLALDSTGSGQAVRRRTESAAQPARSISAATSATLSGLVPVEGSVVPSGLVVGATGSVPGMPAASVVDVAATDDELGATVVLGEAVVVVVVGAVVVEVVVGCTTAQRGSSLAEPSCVARVRRGWWGRV